MATDDKWKIRNADDLFGATEDGEPLYTLSKFDLNVIKALHLYKPFQILYHTTLESTPLEQEEQILADLTDYIETMFSLSAQ